MAYQLKEHRCEVDKCTAQADRLNETVRKRGTENVKIINICKKHYEAITGAK